MTQIEQAAFFHNNFVPEPGVDYGWVLAQAKEQWRAIDASLKQVDAKAMSIITHFGNGTGLVTFAAIAGAASNTISPWVVLATFPSFVIALASIFYSIRARNPRDLLSGPSPATCVEYIKYYQEWGVKEEASKQAEYAMMKVWYVSYAHNYAALNDKVSQLNLSMTWKIRAIVCLAIPLLTAFVLKIIEPLRASIVLFLEKI